MSEVEQEFSQAEIDAGMRKVQKLLALGKEGRGATEEEANTAMAQAQKIMAKFNFDMATIEAQQGIDKPSVERLKEELTEQAYFKWQRQLGKYVAEANFCYHVLRSEWIDSHYEDEAGNTVTEDADDFRDRRLAGELRYITGRQSRNPRHTIVGRRANVMTAKLMFSYLLQTVMSQTPEEYRSNRTSYNSWREGCAEKLCERLSERRRDLIEQHDAQVRADMEATKADIARRAAAEEAKRQHVLPANEAAEVRAAIGDLQEQAYDRSGYVQEPAPVERPETNENDTWTPGQSEADDIPVVTALVLASAYDESEQEANKEIALGLAPGQYAKWRREAEERRKEREAEEAEEDAAQAAREASGEVDRIEKPVKEETERQRVARERRQAEEHAKNRRRWAREDAAEARKERREWEKKDHAAYYAGSEKGESIGLDLQVEARDDSKRLG